MNHWKWIILIVMGWALSSCHYNNVEIDNPSSEPITVVFAGESYQVPPKSVTYVTIEPGMYPLQIEEGEGIAGVDTTVRVEAGGLINPTGAAYYIWTDLYGDKENREVQLKEDWVKVGKKQLFGDIFSIPPSQEYVEKKWDYGLEKPFPKDLLGWQFNFWGDKFILKSKLFREDQLLGAYQQAAGKPTPK